MNTRNIIININSVRISVHLLLAQFGARQTVSDDNT
jgi:hypothetical protein